MDKEIEEIIKAIPKELFLEVYGDGAKGPLVQFGKLGEQLIKTLRLIGYPIQFAAHKQDMIDARFAKALENVPEERKIIPPTSLVLEVADKLKYHPEDSIVSELYVDLLTCSMDADRIQTAHPAFIHLIGQLSADEATFLLLLSEYEVSTYVRRLDDWLVVDKAERDSFLNKSALVSENKETLLKNITMNPEDFFYPENFYTYIEHLRDLGLIAYSNEPKRKIKEEFGCRGYDYWFIELSKFGRLFFECCSRGLKSSKS
ncbi:DUF4393 domain-containing protein [Klebsiella pneumoniae]|uniref:DUF4393 domain-containing protein n=1 Tax=Klebsiella quasipneumoniae TaxID=1463165 RepID=UPI0021810C44|nr:DUF4393 domain-containing protein [Klebsiella quasipneumoniae]EKL1163908.1 DUF4393 domain-containing protein [Klebsiella pneumoniae]EKL1408765.1 DUF4393 domain-containing protein [Klebsiella pneumoniae]EKW9147256.1 DUF4393 domain-containing protein [Klebsiella pneumoniae]GKP63247.1 hypothetical protein NUKP47_19940 [Klebsiella quasipneumoniae]HBZ4037542.1 DUF4393 domain-containing protein [Klebsiella pneumoniae]